MPVTSAGLLLYRAAPAIEVFIAHMGGPFWARKQTAAWTIPKGELDEPEEPRAAALREFAEEIGTEAPAADYADLGAFRYASGKVVHVFAGEAPTFAIEELRSNTFEIEWPRGSGAKQAFPEVDRAAWFEPDAAIERILEAQAPLVERCLLILEAGP